MKCDELKFEQHKLVVGASLTAEVSQQMQNCLEKIKTLEHWMRAYVPWTQVWLSSASAYLRVKPFKSVIERFTDSVKRSCFSLFKRTHTRGMKWCFLFDKKAFYSFCSNYATNHESRHVNCIYIRRVRWKVLDMYSTPYLIVKCPTWLLVLFEESI